MRKLGSIFSQDTPPCAAGMFATAIAVGMWAALTGLCATMVAMPPLVKAGEGLLVALVAFSAGALGARIVQRKQYWEIDRFERFGLGICSVLLVTGILVLAGLALGDGLFQNVIHPVALSLFPVLVPIAFTVTERFVHRDPAHIGRAIRHGESLEVQLRLHGFSER